MVLLGTSTAIVSLLNRWRARASTSVEQMPASSRPLNRRFPRASPEKLWTWGEWGDQPG